MGWKCCFFRCIAIDAFDWLASPPLVRYGDNLQSLLFIASRQHISREFKISSCACLSTIADFKGRGIEFLDKLAKESAFAPSAWDGLPPGIYKGINDGARACAARKRIQKTSRRGGRNGPTLRCRSIRRPTPPVKRPQRQGRVFAVCSLYRCGKICFPFGRGGKEC